MNKLELRVKNITVLLPIERITEDGVEFNLALVPIDARRVLQAKVFDPDASHRRAVNKFNRNHGKYGCIGRGWKPVDDE